MRATSRIRDATSKATAHSVKRLMPSAVKLMDARSESGTAVPTMVAAMTPNTAMADYRGYGPLRVVGEALEVFDTREHEGEEDDDYDCAAVDQELRQREELGECQQEEAGYSDHRGE